MSATTGHRRVELKVAGERRATALALVTNRPDHDLEAFAPHFAPPATVPLGRAHDQLTGGDAPPFGIARITEVDDRYVADIEFLGTTRGQEEYATAKALDAAGVAQDVSIGFQTLEAGPPPESLRALGVRRYITKARFLELSLVGVGAVPGAQLTSVKCDACAGKQATPAPKLPPSPLADLVPWIPSWPAEQAARRALSFSVRYWNLRQAPTLKSFRPNGRNVGQFLGDREPPEVWVATGQDARQSCLTALHEAIHAREHQEGRPPSEGFAERWAERLLAEHPALLHAEA